MISSQGSAGKSTMRIASDSSVGSDRRQFRRHDLEPQGIAVERFNANRQSKREVLGSIVDISAGGVRVRTRDGNLRPDHQIRVRLELPAYAGISPFVDTTANSPQPKREWVGWMTVSRVQRIGDQSFEVSGRLVDMEELDRGMLGLYLSTQPLAA
ncbi:MAG TPA: PilZ domain-containing protein [Humisphaera sp.]|jgi:hypothetical protein|nr:PilZ domain-containing protein [Humisphaera sp.]